MSKSPAFQFYPDKFIGSTAHMSCEEVGAYLRLLCYQWENEFIPEDLSKIVRITGAKKAAIPEVLKKFIKGGGGLINERLEVSRVQQIRFRDAQFINGKKGGRPRKNENPNETQNNPSLLNGLTQIEPKKSPSSSSSSSITNVINLSKEPANFFLVGLQKYGGLPSELATQEFMMSLEQQTYGSGFTIQQVLKKLDEDYRGKDFNSENHFKNSIGSTIKILKNGTNKKFNSEPKGGATNAIRSGQVKDFGKIEL